MKKIREKAIKRYLNGESPKVSTGAWVKERPGFLNGLRGTNWMGQTGRKDIAENPTRVPKGSIRRKNRWLLLSERNWKINYMRKSGHLPLVMT